MDGRAKMRFLLVLPAMLIAATGAAAAASEEVTAVRDTVDGVEYVRNGAVPRDGSRELRTREAWRLDAETAEPLIGVVTQILTDADGKVYLIDGQLAEVKVYSRDGEYLRTLGREGDGPGEVRQPMGAVLRDGGGVGIVQPMPGRLVMIDGQGVPAGTVELGGTAGDGIEAVASVRRFGEILLVTGASMRFGEKPAQVFHLDVYDLEGTRRVRLLENSIAMDFANLHFDERELYFPARDGCTMAEDGLVYVPLAFDRYAVGGFDLEGKLVRVIERVFEHRRRSDAEKEAAREAFAALGAAGRAASTVADFQADLTAVCAVSGGRLRVESSRSDLDLPEGIALRWDVFDASGVFVEELLLRLDIDPLTDGIVYDGGDRLFVLHNATDAARNWAAASTDGSAPAGAGEDTFLQVICYDASFE